MILRIRSQHAEQEEQIDDEVQRLAFSLAIGPGRKRARRPQHTSKDGGRTAYANESVTAHGADDAPSLVPVKVPLRDRS